MEATISKDSVVYEHTDKIKPKFHEGDWVTNGIDCVFQIASIENGIYYDINNCGSDIESTDKSYHLWSIDDAKDGDILTVTMYPEGTWIGIFKEQNGCTFSSHCFVNTEGTFKLGTHGHGNGRAIHPATKEQRDLLFKAMADAGYTFDFEGKELKKIEDEPENFKQQLMDEMTDLITDYIQQKPVEWNEEDMAMLDSAIAFVEHSAFTTIGKGKGSVVAWLKSLKERVLPQTTWKPSEEQLEALDSATENCAYSEYQDCLRELIGQLKKLKEE